MDCSPPGFSVHGTFLASLLELVPFLIPGDLPHPRDQTGISGVSCVGRRILCPWCPLVERLSETGEIIAPPLGSLCWGGPVLSANAAVGTVSYRVFIPWWGGSWALKATPCGAHSSSSPTSCTFFFHCLRFGHSAVSSLEWRILRSLKVRAWKPQIWHLVRVMQDKTWREKASCYKHLGNLNKM